MTSRLALEKGDGSVRTKERKSKGCYFERLGNGHFNFFLAHLMSQAAFLNEIIGS